MKFMCTPLEGHLQLCTAVAFSKEGTNACSASLSVESTCHVWRVEDATCYFVLDGDTRARVVCCNFSANGKSSSPETGAKVVSSYY